MSDKKEKEDAEVAAKEAVEQTAPPAPVTSTEAPAPAPVSDLQAAPAPAPVSDLQAAPAPPPAPTPPPAQVAPPQKAPAEESGPIQVIGERPTQPIPFNTQQDEMQRHAEALAFADDVNNGKIEPKTLHDLYAYSYDKSGNATGDRSTLSKVGTLFGLLVSGAGSGLAHQSNAVLDMMNKQIERDVDAQKTNQTNKQTWYKMAMENENNKYLNQERQAITEGQLGKNVGTALENEMQAHINKDTGVKDVSASNTSYTHGAIFALQNEQDKINRMAPGPTRDAYQQKFDTEMRPYFINQITQHNKATSQKLGVVHAIKSAQNPVKPEEDLRAPISSEKSLNDRLFIGRQIEQNPKKGYNQDLLRSAIPPRVEGPLMAQVQAVRQNRNNYADHLAMIDALRDLPEAGEAKKSKVFSSIAKAAAAAAGAVFGKGAGPVGGLAGEKAGEIGGEGISAAMNAYIEKAESLRNAQIDAMLPRLSGTEEERRKFLENTIPHWYDIDDDKALKIKHDLVVQHYKDNEPNVDYMKNYGVYKPFVEHKYVPIRRSSDVPRKEKIRERKVGEPNPTPTERD